MYLVCQSRRGGFGNYLHRPRREVELLPRVNEFFGHFVQPVVDPSIDQRFHFLDVGKAVLLHCQHQIRWTVYNSLVLRSAFATLHDADGPAY